MTYGHPASVAVCRVLKRRREELKGKDIERGKAEKESNRKIEDDVNLQENIMGG